MRLDRKLNRTGLLKQQLFFVECWASLCQKNNIDSDRVAFNNVLYSINELLELYAFGDSHRAPEKRLLVMAELLAILENDAVLQLDEFGDIPTQIVALCQVALLEDLERSPVEKSRKLVTSLLEELKARVTEHYRSVAVKQLKQLLFAV